MQRQIDRILRSHRRYARAYVNDIIIYSKSLTKHIDYLIKVFDILRHHNIFLKLIKIFIKYFIMQLLN